MRTRLKHLFGALESWKRSEEDAKGEAAARFANFTKSMDEAGCEEGVGSKRPSEISGMLGVSAASDAAANAAAGKVVAGGGNTNGKRPLKKVASGSSE